MICGENDICREGPFETSATANSVHSCNHWFVEIAKLLQAAKPTNAIIAIYCVSTSGRLEVPARAEKLITCTSDNGYLEVGIITEGGKCITHNFTSLEINRVGLRAIQCNLKDAIFYIGFNWAHTVFLISASTAIAACAVQIRGLISTSSRLSAFANT